MVLVRWQPSREIDGLQREMNQLFDSLVSDSEGRSPATFAPLAELKETEDAYHLSLEVPGMNPEDLDIQVTAEAVVVSGERKSEAKTEERGMTRTEFRYGQFRRAIPVPGRIQNNQVTAEYKNGILQLNLPKAEEERNKVVKVKIS